MFTWAVILPMLRKAAPYLLIAAAVGAVWLHGRHSGVESERGRTLAAITERDEARAAAENNYQQWERSEAARERQSEAIRDMEQATADADERVRAAHRAEVERLARQHARVLADAQRRADALAERVRDLSVAETCHEAMLALAGD